MSDLKAARHWYCIVRMLSLVSTELASIALLGASARILGCYAPTLVSVPTIKVCAQRRVSLTSTTRHGLSLCLCCYKRAFVSQFPHIHFSSPVFPYSIRTGSVQHEGQSLYLTIMLKRRKVSSAGVLSG